MEMTLNLGEPFDPLERSKEVCWDKTKRQGLAKGQMVVGRARSTQSLGKPSTSSAYGGTRGRGQQLGDSFRTSLTNSRKLGQRKRDDRKTKANKRKGL